MKLGNYTTLALVVVSAGLASASQVYAAENWEVVARGGEKSVYSIETTTLRKVPAPVRTYRFWSKLDFPDGQKYIVLTQATCGITPTYQALQLTEFDTQGKSTGRRGPSEPYAPVPGTAAARVVNVMCSDMNTLREAAR